MAIWFDEKIDVLECLKQRNHGTLCDHIGIEFTEIGDDYLTATMPYSEQTRQYMNILHGGASCVLAETVGSVAANLVVDQNKFRAVGLDINANHLRPVTKGLVTGIAKPIMIGRTTQVWEIKMVNDENKMTCISRLTMSVISAEKLTKVSE
jgi:1,4-dihydroxy-2-naphthoyl-CoA hydrolase